MYFHWERKSIDLIDLILQKNRSLILGSDLYEGKGTEFLMCR